MHGVRFNFFLFKHFVPYSTWEICIHTKTIWKIYYKAIKGWYLATTVCLYVCSHRAWALQNSWTYWDAVLDVDSWGPVKHVFIRWGLDPHAESIFGAHICPWSIFSTLFANGSSKSSDASSSYQFCGNLLKIYVYLAEVRVHNISLFMLVNEILEYLSKLSRDGASKCPT